jgi:hypothetical protein
MAVLNVEGRMRAPCDLDLKYFIRPNAPLRSIVSSNNKQSKIARRIRRRGPAKPSEQRLAFVFYGADRI